MSRRIVLAGIPLLMFLGSGAYVARQRQLSGSMVAPRGSDVAVLAGGCYWGVESVFRHVRGVTSVTSGFAMPVPATPNERPGPAEAVRLEYNPSQISYHKILEIFFTVVHDPTQVNRQGPDVGPEYRSMIFTAPPQQAAARAFIDSLTAAHVYTRPIATRIAALESFEPADPSQQNYAETHPNSRYVVINDVPKLKALAERFPSVYRR